MSNSANLVFHQGVRLDYERLCRAIQDATAAKFSTTNQLESLAEIRSFRARIAFPLHLQSERLPNPQDRAQISGLGQVTISVASDNASNKKCNTTICLGADLVSVALALSDELVINELDAAVLLFDARERAAHRSDHDVVAAAKELAALRRRESILYLQEILRASLLASENDLNQDDGFVSYLMRERDMLVTEHNVFNNVANRLLTAFEALKSQPLQQRDTRCLQQGEFVLLAETLFLLAYTIQLPSLEALSVRSLLQLADETCKAIHQKELAIFPRGIRPIGSSLDNPNDPPNNSQFFTKHSQTMSSSLIEAESVRNLLLLTWTCALDRSRYHDLYDPRTKLRGVNVLLKDLEFIPQTTIMPKLEDDQENDNVRDMPTILAAAELSAAVFRLAVASPDEEKVTTCFLRASAYGGALSFFSNDLSSWIEKRAGFLSPDKDLYADVLEDLALDVAESSHLVSSLIIFSQNEVNAAASAAAYASLDVPNENPPLSRQNIPQRSGYNRGKSEFHSSALVPTRSPAPSRSTLDFGESRKPWKPPIFPSHSSRRGQEARTSVPNGTIVERDAYESKRPDMESENHGSTTENLLASLAIFVARAIALAPSKLANDSMGGGARYWVGIGHTNMGFIPRIGDAVTDLWDFTMRNPDSVGGASEAFSDALKGFLMLLSSISHEQGTAAHASLALRYLNEGGHPVLSLEHASAAFSYFQNLLSASSWKDAQLDERESDALYGIVDVLATSVVTLRSHGGFLPILGEPSKDLAMHMGSLAVQDIPASLKESMIRALLAMDFHAPITGFLTFMAKDKASALRRFVRSVESQAGMYDVTIRVLEMATSCVKWEGEAYPEAHIESITIWFAIEEILAYWSRRKYADEAQRWKVIGTVAKLIHAVVCRDPNSSRTNRILARLLTPTPGTGAASYSLRALLCASGLMRAGSEKDMPSSGLSSVNGSHNWGSNLYHISGRDSLIHAADHGLGEAYVEMQKASQVSAQMILLVLSIPPARISFSGTVVVPASELLLGEVMAIGSAASLVFTVNGFVPSISRAGYSPSVCAAILAMLAKGAQESQQIGAILTRDDQGSNRSAAQFRSSIANIISHCVSEASSSNDINSGSDPNFPNENEDPSILFSVLKLVEASLGTSGGSEPGMFLLGLQLDGSGRYSMAEYGVLGALIELVAGLYDPTGRVDTKYRSTAAIFLERLAANTIRSTSQAVLEHLKEVGHMDSSVRGGGFADEMLFRILEATESINSTSVIDWGSLGELIGACMSLSALQVRLFPEFELDICSKGIGAQRPLDTTKGDDLRGSEQTHPLPPPLELLRVVSSVAGHGQAQAAVEALRTWRHLVGIRLNVHERNSGYCSVPLLFELVTSLLDALGNPDTGNDMASVMRHDDGDIASAVALLCLSKMRECDNRADAGTEQHISDVQCSGLLTSLVRALAGSIVTGLNASRSRTSLYTALLVCGSIAEKKLSRDAISRSLGGRHGHRQVSGTHVVISAACVDAVSSPSAGDKSAAMAVTSLLTQLDPIRAISVLGAQNRLRRVIQSSLGDAEAIKLISQSCPRHTAETNGQPDKLAGMAAIAVAEAALALIHAVASVGHGARVIADSGCVEMTAKVLPALEFWSTSKYGNQGLGRFEKGNEDGLGMSDWRSKSGIGGDMVHTGVSTGRKSTGRYAERRIAMISRVGSAIAAALGCAGGTVMDSAVLALDEGKNTFVTMINEVGIARNEELKAISALGMILSRIPEEMLMSTSGCLQLRTCLGGIVGSIAPMVSKGANIGDCGSTLSGGVNLIPAENSREERRMKILHPLGGALFERDMVTDRALCMQSIFAALRHGGGIVYLFNARLGGFVARGEEEVIRGGGIDGRPADVSVVVHICKGMVRELQWAVNEAEQVKRRINTENGLSMSSQHMREIEAYWQEELDGISGGNSGGGDGRFTSDMAKECLEHVGVGARQHADVCIGVFESCLFILMEYVREARDIVSVWGSTERREGGDDANGVVGRDGKSGMSFEQAEGLLEDAKLSLLPLCEDVEQLHDGVWGTKDGNFPKQICRQIRTMCKG